MWSQTSERKFRNARVVKMDGFRKVKFYFEARPLFQFVHLRGSIISFHSKSSDPPYHILDLAANDNSFSGTGRRLKIFEKHGSISITCYDQHEAQMWLEAMCKGTEHKFQKYYDLGRILREGTSFIDYEAIKKGDRHSKFTARVLKKDINNTKMVENIHREEHVSISLCHPQIVRGVDLFNGILEDILVFEPMIDGTLADMRAHFPLSTDLAKNIMRQVLRGLCHIHDLNIVHRDLCPENIFLTNGPSGIKAKLGGFGKCNFGDQRISSGLFSTFIGLSRYTAADMMSETKYSTVSDIWSFGVMLYEVLTGRVLFSGSSYEELSSQISCGISHMNPIRITDDILAERLIIQTLQKDPFKRLTAKGALAHDWFQSTPLNSHMDCFRSCDCNQMRELQYAHGCVIQIVPFVKCVASIGLQQAIEKNRFRSNMLLESPLIQLQLSSILRFRRKIKITALAFIAICRLGSLRQKTCSTMNRLRDATEVRKGSQTIETADKVDGDICNGEGSQMTRNPNHSCIPSKLLNLCK